MMIPANPTLPQQSILSPMQMMGKLNGFSGLGCGCSQTDDTGGCLDPELCSAPVLPSTDTTLSDWQALVGSAAAGGAETAPALTSVGAYRDANGNIVIPGQGSISPSGAVTTYPAPANPAAAAAPHTGLTAAQQASLAASLISGGFSLAKEATAQPGMVIGPNGQISYQNPGFPVAGIAGSLTTPSSSSLMMVGVVAVAALALFSFSGRGR